MASAIPIAVQAVTDWSPVDHLGTKAPDHSGGQFASLVAQFAQTPKAPAAPAPAGTRPAQSDNGTPAPPTKAPLGTASQVSDRPDAAGSQAPVPSSRADVQDPKAEAPNPGTDGKTAKSLARAAKADPPEPATPSTSIQTPVDASAAVAGALSSLQPSIGTPVPLEDPAAPPTPPVTVSAAAAQISNPGTLTAPSRGAFPTSAPAPAPGTKTETPAPQLTAALLESQPTSTPVPKAQTPKPPLAAPLPASPLAASQAPVAGTPAPPLAAALPASPLTTAPAPMAEASTPPLAAALPAFPLTATQAPRAEAPTPQLGVAPLAFSPAAQAPKEPTPTPPSPVALPESPLGKPEVPKADTPATPWEVTLPESAMATTQAPSTKTAVAPLAVAPPPSPSAAISPAILTQPEAQLSSGAGDAATPGSASAPKGFPTKLEGADPVPSPLVPSQPDPQATSPVDATSIKSQASAPAVITDVAARMRSAPNPEDSLALADTARLGTTPVLKAVKIADLQFLAQGPVERKAQPFTGPMPSDTETLSPAGNGKAGTQIVANPETAPPTLDALALKSAIPVQTLVPHALDGSALAAASLLPRPVETATIPAPAPTPPPAARPSAPVLQVEGGLRWMLKGGVQEAQLQLHPDSLGQVTIHLKVVGGEVHARLWITEPGSVQAVQEGRPHLEQSLKEQGLQLGSFDLPQGHRPFQEAPSASPLRETSAAEIILARQEAPAAVSVAILNPHHVELYA